MSYNFRIGPEALWLIGSTVIGTVLVEVLADFANLTTLPSIDDLQLWGAALAVSAIRTLIGAILAAATHGGFQAPGEPKPPTA